ncbi:Metallo-hydrolase/oxidoreductase [Schizopora paradoxa]|uniref:Metallo-hydrolase/oxidoreductase n=1 Tax=Schizopora paradoxa TaxID=27342 RepID=A0A0H2S1I4_9AGAM|nr:Metallo-hydrolase/oxidoreductase [Schizopora paradoxa]
MASTALPPPGENQVYWDVSVLEGGHLVLDISFFITTASPGTKFGVPCLSFLLKNSVTKEYFLFDLGVRKDYDNYPPPVKEIFFPTAPCTVPQDVVESLEKGGVKPTDIKHVCISHLHWDHVGHPPLFSNATFLLGSEGKTLLSPAYPEDPTSPYSDDYPKDKTKFLSIHEPGWTPLGPFPHALDYFGDGSLYIIDAPGHVPGHINALVRTSADGGWIYLAGDSAHHWSLITGESEIAGTPTGLGRFSGCAHEKKEVAAENMRRVRELTKMPRVRVILAHDEPWYKENKGGNAFWPGKLPSL